MQKSGWNDILDGVKDEEMLFLHVPTDHSHGNFSFYAPKGEKSTSDLV